MKVMIVDDERNIRDGIIHFIDWGSLDCEITASAKNGQEALAILQDQEMDLIISDIKMPVLDGLELAKNVKDQYPETKMIILTAYSDFYFAKKAIQFDVVDFVVKNEFIQELPAAVEKAKEQLKKERESRSQDLSLDHAAYRKELLRRMLKGKAVEQKDRENYGSDAECKALIFCEIDEEAAQKSGLDHKKLDLFVDKSFEQYQVDRIDWEENSMVILVRGQGPLQTAVTAFVEMMKGFMNIDVRMGISFNEGKTLRIIFDQAKEALLKGCQKDETIRYFQESEHSGCQKEKTEKFSIERWQTLFFSKSFGEHENLDELIVGFVSELKCSGRNLKQIRMDFLVLGAAIIRRNKKNEDPEWEDIRKSYYQWIHSSWSLYCLSSQLRRLLNVIEDVRMSQNQEKTSLVYGVNRYIQNNYQQNVSLQELSQALFLSGSYISRAYKKATGVTVTDAIHEYRLNQAMELLLRTDMKIYEVCIAVGIEDPAYFTRLFMRRVGMSPTEYRSKNR
ncbi:hypothetical protein SANA_00810 [Gottschalkiaceae bacterium SANA]|nr:hypothetical protein SANA_00810 [Gottschalkiaceae bacterium SANA]